MKKFIFLSSILFLLFFLHGCNSTVTENPETTGQPRTGTVPNTETAPKPAPYNPNIITSKTPPEIVRSGDNFTKKQTNSGNKEPVLLSQYISPNNDYAKNRRENIKLAINLYQFPRKKLCTSAKRFGKLKSLNQFKRINDVSVVFSEV